MATHTRHEPAPPGPGMMPACLRQVAQRQSPTSKAENEHGIDEAELHRMTEDERFQLARALAVLDVPPPLIDSRVRRRRQLGLLLIMSCCIFLAGWIAMLILTLPGHYTSSDWRAVWVGFDVAELTGFAATGWAAWHRRQVVIIFMIITGTLLLCDAWFDVALDYGSSGFVTSVVSAGVAELPLAFIMFASARRLMRVSVQTVMHLAGIPGPAPSLRRVPLFAAGLQECLPARFRSGAADVTAADRSSA
jgi:hypothetical protein